MQAIGRLLASGRAIPYATIANDFTAYREIVAGELRASAMDWEGWRIEDRENMEEPPIPPIHDGGLEKRMRGMRRLWGEESRNVL